MPKRAVAAPSPVASPPETATATATPPKRQARRRAKAATTRTAPGAAGPRPVVIAGVGAEPIEVPQDPAFEREAMDWQRIVRNRIRWTSQPEVRDAQAKRSKALLSSLGVDLAALGQLADGGIVQVSVPYERESEGWAARIFPWEYVLSSATRDRSARPLVIVRRLVRAGGAADRPLTDPATDRLLIVESAPGTIRSRFQFDSERGLVRAALGEGVALLPDPTEDQLRATIEDAVPAVVHLSGVDAHQGARVTGKPDPGWDGYVLADPRGQPMPVAAQRLGSLLAAGKRKPRLVSCNFENSAARVAAMAVAEGAAAAVGFQDSVDDALAELFFSRFYANWVALGSETVRAFVRTLDDLRSRPGVLTGLGIVLWSDEDFVSDKDAARVGQNRSVWTVQSVAPPFAATPDAIPTELALAVAPEGIGDGAPGPVAVAAVRAGEAAAPGEAPAPAARPQRLVPGRVTGVREPPAVWAELTIRDHVNFVHLHNNGSLFETFRLRKSSNEDVTGVEVEVVLFVGRHSFPYKATKTLRQPVTELRDEIRVPLTADLLRTVHETIQSVVYVRVRRERLTVYEDTLPVRIASADEWMDTDTETRWLPSFVLPTDPAIEQLRSRSLPALRALDDTFGGGYLGYQALGLEGTRYRKVDVQANAIWSTLSFLYELSYVNPPPIYTARAQRLRTPTEIARSQSGTCIDLALLFAACLEAIDIYPVILMYEGHANVGYWRSPAFHEAFQTLQTALTKKAGKERKRRWAPKDRSTADGSPAAPDPAALKAPVDAWELQRQSAGEDANLNEVMARIDRQDLAVLETTLLTDHAGFGDAIRKGQDAFRERAFRSLVDIRIARKTSVTPLPIHYGE